MSLGGCGGTPAVLLVLLVLVVNVRMVMTFSFRSVEPVLWSRLDAGVSQRLAPVKGATGSRSGAQPKASTERVRIAAQRTLDR